jgi:5-methylcytosine-specific restriction endonuclease McrA
MRKPSRKTLIKKCDSLWGKIVHLRGSCEVCGSKKTLQAHHFFSKKGHPNTRHDTDNGVLLCYYDHLIRIHQLGDPEVIKFIIDKRGQEWYDNLTLKAHKTVKLDYNEILKKLEAEYESCISKDNR